MKFIIKQFSKIFAQSKKKSGNCCGLLDIPKLACLLFLLSGFVYSQQLGLPQKFDEKQLSDNFETFINHLDSLDLSVKYPEITRRILSSNPNQQKIALKMLGESQEIIAIPWILLLLNSEDSSVKISAGQSLQDIVSSIALNRRDSRFARFVILKPLGKQDIDLKPLAWIVLKLLRSGDQNLISFATVMVRYLNLYDFDNEILKHFNSNSPAVADTVKWVIKALDIQKKYESGELSTSDIQ